MDVYVINLLRRPDRRMFMEEQIAQVGVVANWISAVDARLMSSTPDGTLVSVAEHACFMSHVKALHRIALGSQEYALVLEDDAVLGRELTSSDLLQRLPRLMLEMDLDLLQLGHISHLQKRSWRQSLARRLSGDAAPGESVGQFPKLHVKRGRFAPGAHCYVISRPLAGQLRHLNQPVWLPTDDFYDRFALTSHIHGSSRIGYVLPSLAEQATRANPALVLDSDIAQLKTREA